MDILPALFWIIYTPMLHGDFPNTKLKKKNRVFKVPLERGFFCVYKQRVEPFHWK